MSKNISSGYSQLLHSAAKSGNAQMITALARTGADLKATDEASETPLVKEAFDGLVSAIKKTTNVEARKQLVAQYTNAMQALIVNGAKVIEEPGEFKEFALPLWNADGACILGLESALRPISLSNIVSPNFTKKDFDDTLSLLKFAPDEVKERVMNDPLIKYLVSLPTAKLEELCKRPPEEAAKIDVKQLLDAQKQTKVQETSVKPVMNPASALPNASAEKKDLVAQSNSKATTVQAELCDIFRFGTGLDKVPELLRQGANINKADSLNKSPLELALEYTKPTSIAMLAELKMDFNKPLFQNGKLVKPVEILQNRLKHPDISESEKDSINKTLSALIINGAKYGGQIPSELAPALKAKRLTEEENITLRSILAEGFKPQQFRDMIKLADECAALKNKRRFNESHVMQQLQELSDKDLELILAKAPKEAKQAEQDLERLYKETTERHAAEAARRAEAVAQHEAPAVPTQSSVLDAPQNASHETQTSVQNIEVPAQPAQTITPKPGTQESVKQSTWGDTVKGYWNRFKGAPAPAQAAPKASKEVEDFLELAPANSVSTIGRDKMIQQLGKLSEQQREAICKQDPQTIENIVKHWNDVYDTVSKVRADYANPEYIANVADALELKAVQKQVDPYLHDLTKDWEKALPANLASQYQTARKQYNRSAAKFNNKASKGKKGGIGH